MGQGIDHATATQRLKQELLDWQVESESIVKTFATTGWKSSLMVVNAIGHLAENTWHHPKLVVEYSGVSVWLTTHSEGGITDKDFALAHKIEDLLGPPPDDSALQAPPNQYAILKLK